MWNRRWKRRHDMRAEYLLMLATFLIVILVLAVAAITALR
jgi:hypothetical protein